MILFLNMALICQEQRKFFKEGKYMAFEYKTYSDGDITFSRDEWRKNLEELSLIKERILIKELQEETYIDEEGIALKHPDGQSFFQLKANGEIRCFNQANAGFLINKEGQITFYGNKLQFLVKEVDHLMTPNGFTLNGKALKENEVQNFPRQKGKSEGLLALLAEQNQTIG